MDLFYFIVGGMYGFGIGVILVSAYGTFKVSKSSKLDKEPLSLLRDADTITLSRKDAEVFFNALNELKEANEALKAAAKLYQK